MPQFSLGHIFNTPFLTGDIVPFSRWISKVEEWGKLPLGKTTCHRLTGGQRSGHQGDQLQMHFPKVGIGTRGSETRLPDSQPHTGETEARSSTAGPGHTASGLRPQARPAPGEDGRVQAPGPCPVSSSWSTSPTLVADATAGKV